MLLISQPLIVLTVTFDCKVIKLNYLKILGFLLLQSYRYAVINLSFLNVRFYGALRSVKNISFPVRLDFTFYFTFRCFKNFLIMIFSFS